MMKFDGLEICSFIILWWFHCFHRFLSINARHQRIFFNLTAPAFPKRQALVRWTHSSWICRMKKYKVRIAGIHMCALAVRVYFGTWLSLPKPFAQLMSISRVRKIEASHQNGIRALLNRKVTTWRTHTATILEHSFKLSSSKWKWDQKRASGRRFTGWIGFCFCIAEPQLPKFHSFTTTEQKVSNENIEDKSKTISIVRLLFHLTYIV